MSVADNLKLFGMHNLMLESELNKLESNGIQIEHARTIRKAEVVDVELFETDILQEGGSPGDGAPRRDHGGCRDHAAQLEHYGLHRAENRGTIIRRSTAPGAGWERSFGSNTSLERWAAPTSASSVPGAARASRPSARARPGRWPRAEHRVGARPPDRRLSRARPLRAPGTTSCGRRPSLGAST